MLTLLYIALFAGFVPVCALLFKNKSKFSTPVKPFLYLTALGSLYEFIFTITLKVDMRVWFTLYDILAFACIYYYFFKLNTPRYRIVFNVFLAVFVLTAVPAVYFASQSIQSFLTVQAVFSGIITLFVIVMTVLWFTDIFRKMEVPNLWHIPDFYYVAGFFIYYSVTFFLFLLSEVILEQGVAEFVDYWVLNIAAVLFLRILLTVGVWKSIRK